MSLLPDQPPTRKVWEATRWSRVGSLDGPPDAEREASWEYLVNAYLAPMQGYAKRLMSRLRGRPCPAQEAAALVQDFLGTCVEKEWLSRADPAAGPFRAFLQVLLRRYVYGRVKHDRAQKRSPADGSRVLSLIEGEAAETLTEEERLDIDAFDKSWAEVAVDRARKRMAEKHDLYNAVVDDLLLTHGEGSEDLAERLGRRSAQLPLLRFRARQMFAQLFEEELLATVGNPQQFQEEWRVLQPYLP
jgi:hypothetical protein